MNKVSTLVLILLAGFDLSHASIVCGNREVFDYTELKCVFDVLQLGAQCDTMNDKCPMGTFCSPRFLRCMNAMSEGQRCSNRLAKNEVFLCNKNNQLYCLGGICRKVVGQNIVIDRCGVSCGDPAHFFCNPYTGNCEEYRVAGQACNKNIDFCKKSQGFYCADDLECRLKY